MDVPIRYSVDLSGVKRNQVRVEMTVEPPADGPVDVALPFMSPGSPVNSRNHTAKLSQLQVTDGDGHALPYEKLPEGGWRVQRGAEPLQISYTLMADEFAASKNHLSTEHAYLNGAAAFMFLKGHDTDVPATVSVKNVPDPSWGSISTLPEVKGMPNTWYAITYQELADSNIELGRFERADGEQDGTRITVVRHGSSPYKRLVGDGVSAEQNVADFKRIYRAFGVEFGTFPSQRYKVSPALPPEVDSSDRYTIIKHYVAGDQSLAGGFEHYHGHELTFSRANEDGIHRTYGDSPRVQENKVMAHELGHKLLGKLVQHDGIDSCELAREHPSDGLWLTEGVTEWLGTIMERRAGLITPQQYLERLGGQIHRYQQDYRIDPTNPREDSLDAQHGNSEYYTKGAVLGAMLDLEILALSGGQRSFKDVLLGLKDEFGGTGTFHQLEDVQRIAEKVVAPWPGASERMGAIFHDYLVDRRPIDFDRFLSHVGLEMAGRADAWPAERLELAGAALETDGRGRPSVTATASVSPPVGPVPFRTLIPAAGLSLSWGGDGRLRLGSVSPTGPGFAAGLHEFEGAKLEGLALISGDARCELPVRRDVAAHVEPFRGPADAMALTFTRTRQFDGGEERVTVTVPLEDTPRYTIGERADADEAARSLRETWLRETV